MPEVEVEVEVENYQPLNSPSTPTLSTSTHDAEAPSPTPSDAPAEHATLDGQPDEEDDPEHFPWHYTEWGVTCACGLPMDKDETCEAMRVATAAKVDPSGLVGGVNPSTEPSSIYGEIAAERERAHAKHGATSMESQPVDDPTGMRRDILTEEIGEVAREFNDARHDGRPVDLAKLRKELVQVAAMATAWADAIGASS